MIIGVPKEIKNHEYRVALTPAGVKDLVTRNHRVIIEKDAGLGSGFNNEEYKQQGAEIIEQAADVFEKSELIVKVKEPLEQEYAFLKEKQILFTYLHLAAVPSLLEILKMKSITGIAYETVERSGNLPLLTPMSEIAGRMATLIGAQYLQKTHGGCGLLISSVPGVDKTKVAILGGGIVGTNAAKLAVGLGADVAILDISLPRLRYLDEIFGGQLHTIYANSFNIFEVVTQADLVIGAVLVPGAKAPCLVNKTVLTSMKKGAVIVDVAVDQGGCIETTCVTTHSDPVYFVEGVLHYGVANMPGAVPRTSTLALTNATLPYLVQLADLGAEEALKKDAGFMLGLNTYRGKVTHPVLAESMGEIYSLPHTLLMGKAV
jgi:alanine dehydrogenase